GAVNTAPRNFFMQTTDAALPDVGIHFAFTRSYNSQGTDLGGSMGQSCQSPEAPMGPGWTFSYDVFLSSAWDGDVTVHAEDGQQIHFSNLGSGFAADPGVWDTLVKNQDGTYTLTR